MILLRSLLFWLVVSSGVALFWPAERIAMDPFQVSPALLWSLIIITMGSLGMLVRPAELVPLREHPWWVILGVAAQILVMPLAAWIVTRVIPMPAEFSAGVILVGCVPGAMASNVLTQRAGGSVAYSVSLTTVATLLSPFTVPIALWLFSGVSSEEQLLRPSETSVMLLLRVVLPTIGGYVLVRLLPKIERWADSFAPLVASVALLWIIASVVAGNRDQLMGVGGWLVLALLAINFTGYAAGHLAGVWAGQPSRFRRALTLEVGMQNAGLGTGLAVTLYGPQTLSTIPTAAYTFGCMLTGTLLAVYWQHYQRGDQPVS